MDVSKNRGGPQNGWFIMETLLKWMIWGYHYFWKHPCGHSYTLVDALISCRAWYIDLESIRWLVLTGCKQACQTHMVVQWNCSLPIPLSTTRSNVLPYLPCCFTIMSYPKLCSPPIQGLNIAAISESSSLSFLIFAICSINASTARPWLSHCRPSQC